MHHKIALILAVLAALTVCPSGLRAEQDDPAQSAEGRPADPPSVKVTSLHQWLVSRMLNWMPTGRSFIKDAVETKEAGKERYEEIADAMISVVYDPAEKPLFGGEYGRAKTLALLASVAWFESGYRRDVDLGLGALGVGDKGRSWCMMQILLGRKGPDGHTKDRIALTEDYYTLLSSPEDKTAGWGGEDLVKDRVACFRVGLHLARRSFHSCRSYPVQDRLGVYGSGACIRNWSPSQIRVKKAQKWLAADKPPLKDGEAMLLLHPPPPPEGGPEDSEAVAKLFFGGPGTPTDAPFIVSFAISNGIFPRGLRRGIVEW